MSTKLRRASNMRNTAQSTGPRTTLGKLRSRMNARKHGMSLPTAYHPGASAMIEQLACAIAGPDASENKLQAARHLAAAEIEIRRMQQYKIARVNAELTNISMAAPVKPTLLSAFESDRNLLEVGLATVRVLPELAKLERYERRNGARLRRALAYYIVVAGE
jgi:hypothetical protein